MTRSRLIALVASALVLLAGIGLGLWYYGDRNVPMVSEPIVAKPVVPVKKPSELKPANPVKKPKRSKAEKPSQPVPLKSGEYLIHEVKKGETLSGIAAEHGMKKEVIATDNSIKDLKLVRIDQKLKIRKSAITLHKKHGKAAVVKKAAPKKKEIKTALQKKKVAPKKTRWTAFKEWVFSLWVYPGKNAYKGNLKEAKKPESVHEALWAMLGGTEYEELIPVFEEMVKEGRFTLEDIKKGEKFHLMVSTKTVPLKNKKAAKKTVVGKGIEEAWNRKWVKERKITRKAERYMAQLGNEEVMLTFPYACGNWAITFRPLPPPPPAVKPKKSWLEISKEIFSPDGHLLVDREGNLLPVPAFSFTVTNVSTGVQTPVTMDSNGHKAIEVDPGTYRVEELNYPGWVKFLVTPPSGTVTLEPGENKSVNFKNQQLPPERRIPPVTELPPEEVPPEITPPPVAPPAPPITELPPLKVPGEELKKLVSCYGLEVEPSMGTGGWKNGLARGYFAWFNGEIWYQGECGDPIWIGFGGFGAHDKGKSRVSSFRWGGHRVSPNFAVRGYYPYETEEGDERYRMFKFVLRFPAYDVQRGHNKEVPRFKSTQRTFPMLGIWAEGEQGINELWTVGTFADAWISFHTERHSSFPVRPDRKDSFMIGFWAQRKISDNWDARLIIAPFWQGWDNLTGVHIRPELRYKNFFIFGPFANLFPHRSAVYRKGGIRLWRLQTWGGFLRLELRGPLNKLYDRERVKEVVYTEEKPESEVKAFENDTVPTETVSSEETEDKLQTPSPSEEEGLKTGIRTLSQDPEPTHEESHPVNPVNPEIANDLPPDLE